METTERWLSVDEIAAHLDIAAIIVYRWLEKSNIPAHRVGKLWKFKVSEVDSWVQNGGAEDEAMKKQKIDRSDEHQEIGSTKFH